MKRSKNTQAEQRAIRRVARILERHGFLVGFATGSLRESGFDLIALSKFQDRSLDAGAYIRIMIDKLTKEVLEQIGHYETSRKRQIWILVKSSGKKTDPGKFIQLQFEGQKPIGDIPKIVSSAKKSKAALKKTKAAT